MLTNRAKPDTSKSHQFTDMILWLRKSPGILQHGARVNSNAPIKLGKQLSDAGGSAVEALSARVLTECFKKVGHGLLKPFLIHLPDSPGTLSLPELFS